MKNFGTLSFCVVIFMSCATSTVRPVKLSDGSKGYDVTCSENLENCNARAKSICDGRYKVHNSFSEDPLQILEKDSLIMRMQCLDSAALELSCEEDGVNCIL